MAKKKTPSLMSSISSAPAETANPFSQGTSGYTEFEQQNRNPYPEGTSGWMEWQSQHGLPTLPAAVQGPPVTKNQLWAAKKMEQALGQDTLQNLAFTNPSAVGSGMNIFAPKGDIWNKLTGDLAYLQNAGIAQKTTGGGDEANLTRELNMLADRGMQWGNTAMQNPGQISRMAPDLARYGVKSLTDLQPVNVPGYGTLYYNKANNSIIPADFGSSMRGEGGTYFSLKDANGQVMPATKWTNTSDREAIAGALSVLGAAAGLGGLGAFLGGAGMTGLGTTAGNAMVGAGTGALQGGVSGGWQGALKGALSGGLGGAVSAVNPAGMAGVTNPTLQAALNQGLSGALKSGISGTDPTRGALSGALSGAGGAEFGSLGSMAGSMLGNYLLPGSAPQPTAVPGQYPTPSGTGALSQAYAQMSPETRRQAFERVRSQVAGSSAPGAQQMLANLNQIAGRVV